LLDLIDRMAIKRWEENEVKSADVSCYISPLDRAIGAGKKFDSEKIKVIPNGFFLSDYVEDKHDFGCFTVGFIGNMSYPPNIQAALRLARLFLSVVQKNNLNWKLAIIGRLPAPDILALAENKQIIVTGTVDNIWSYVNGVDLFVFPMEIGSGQQNKLLEAMCVSKPVVSTSLGNSGIGATHMEHLIEVETDDALIEAMVLLAGDEAARVRLGQAAKKFVTEKYSWDGIFKVIDGTLLLPYEK
jgi:glycosyltransferase involved in cell wall biosynthesis